MQKRIYTQVFGVAAAIIERQGKILLVQEASGLDEGKWSQPAGLIEVGEDPITAIRREVREETGYTFKPTAVLGLYSIVRGRLRENVPAGVPHGVRVVFLGKIGSKRGSLHGDVTQTTWFTPEEIYSMDQNTLRDVDIKDEIRDYFAGKQYSLKLIHHTVET